MSRFLLLPPFVLWMAWSSNPVTNSHGHVAWFLAGYLIIVLGLGILCRVLARSVHGANIERRLEQFKKFIFLARWVIPVWFGIGLYWMGWGELVRQLLGHVSHWPAELPGVLLGTAPAFGAWAGLYWSQYPADRALREQSLLVQLDNGLPVRSPQGLWSYLSTNLRMQVLFTLLPVYFIVAVRDALFGSMLLAGFHPRDGGPIEIGLSLGAVAIVFPLAPEILRRTLQTRRLPDSDLRQRLEELFDRTRLKCREILLWHTDSTVGNAAVMGLVPRFRYILLSDLLLETMTDEQIEAVFAHEVGHIKHHHMIWNVVMMLLAGTIGGTLGDLLQAAPVPHWLASDMVGSIVSFTIFVASFGWVSRRMERQADVYAARMIESEAMALVGTGAIGVLEKEPTGPTFVGQHGAEVFASALYRVAAINNIRTSPRKWRGQSLRHYPSYLLDRLKHSADNFLHGSIETRRIYLERISAEPALTWRFDRFMRGLYITVIVLLIGMAGWMTWSMMQI